MSYLVIYPFPPENGIKAYLKRELDNSWLPERKINVNVVQGHPLFTEGINQDTIDKFFPVIGVEWVRDKREMYLGQAFREYRNTDDIRSFLQSMKTIPPHERTVTDTAIDKLCDAEFIEQFAHLVISDVVVAGYTSGGNGRSTLRFIYEAVDGIIEGICHDISCNYEGTSLYLMPNIEKNIQSEQFGMPVWGFELMLQVVQPRITIREKKDYVPINEFSVHFFRGKSIFGKQLPENFFNWGTIKNEQASKEYAFMKDFWKFSNLNNG